MGEFYLEIKSHNIMEVLNLYKIFVKNNLGERLNNSKDFLVDKYINELGDMENENSFNLNRKTKELIKDKIKSLALYDLNDKSLTPEQYHEILIMEESGDILQSKNFKTMTRQLQLEKSLKKEDITTQLNILENLWYHIGNAYYYKNDKLVLNELFEAAMDLYCMILPFNGVKIDDEVASLIRAIKYFEKSEITYEIIRGEIVLDSKVHVTIHNRLEKHVQMLGGIETLKRLFIKELQPRYKKEMDRYLIHRNKSTFGKIDTNFNRVPYNYLINICGKYLGSGLVTITKLVQEDIYNKIIDESSKYLDILQLQGYSVYEDMFIDYQNIPEYIYKNMIFENLYIPVQYSSDFVLDTLVKIYKPLYDEKKLRRFRFNDYYKVAHMLLKNYIFCSTIKFEDLRVKLNMSRRILKNILEEISEDKRKINKEYTEIVTSTNLYEKPLVKLSEETYFFISPHFCAYSFCKVLYQILKRAKISNLDRKIGDLTEDYVKFKLNEKGFPFKSGYYSIDNQDNKGQCDIVLETEKDVVFVEIKKRSLPDSFELGDDVEVLRSLGDGMLNAQKQILRHRVYLQKYNFMNLYKEENENSPYTILELKGRRIISISMCLPEYGFLTNKTISSQLLESLIFATYHAADPSKEKSLTKLNKLRDKIAQLAEELKDDEKKDARTIFFDTLFRSLQQFIYVLEISFSVDELVEYLTNEIHLIEGSLDFYSSLYSAVRRNKKIINRSR